MNRQEERKEAVEKQEERKEAVEKHEERKEAELEQQKQKVKKRKVGKSIFLVSVSMRSARGEGA